MTDKAVKVGDVVAWANVPSMAMVSDYGDYVVRKGSGGITVYSRSRTDNGWSVERPIWAWPFFAKRTVSIIALNLTGNETADELRALAEAFEREHPARDA